MREKLGDRSGVLASMVNLAELLFFDGERDAAIRYAEQAASEARNVNALATLALIQANLAGYRLAQDDAAAAAAAARSGLKLCRDMGQDHLAAVCLEHLALALAIEGALLPAARLLGHVDARYKANGQQRDPLEAEGHIRLQNIVRAGLERAELRRAIAEGEGWTAADADEAAAAA